jgi:outer membrane immunogenic protein
MSAKITVSALAAGALAVALSSAAQAQEANLFAGPYVGLVAGKTDGRLNAKNAPLFTQQGSPFFGTFGGTTANSDPDFKLKGGEYGVTAGWNHQSGHVVGGFEGDVSYSDADGQRVFGDRPSPGTNRFNTALSADVKYTATLRARLGWAFGPALLYGTGGFAMSEVKLNRDYTNAAAARIAGDDTHRYFGFTYGAGAEYALNRNWSVKAEYLRLDLGDQQFTTGYSDGSYGVADVRADRDLYRVGVNFRF